MNSNRKQKGFSLIELIIVVSITAMILTSVGLKLRQNNLRRRAENSAMQIKQAIEKFRNYSITGEVVTDGTVSELPRAYLIRYEEAVGVPSKIVLYFIDQDGNEKKDMENEVILNEVGDEIDINFNSGSDIDFKPPNGDSTICTTAAPCVIEVCGNGDCTVLDPELNYIVTVYGSNIDLR